MLCWQRVLQLGVFRRLLFDCNRAQVAVELRGMAVEICLVIKKKLNPLERFISRRLLAHNAHQLLLDREADAGQALAHGLSSQKGLGRQLLHLAQISLDVTDRLVDAVLLVHEVARHRAQDRRREEQKDVEHVG